MSTVLTNGRHTKKVAEVQQAASTYNGQNGKIYKHIVVFEDGTKGEHHSTKETSQEFIVGNEITFDCEIKQNGNYTNYKIKPVKDQKFGGGGGKSYGSSDNGKWVAAIECLKMAIDAAKSDKIKKEEIEPTAKKYFQVVSNIVNG